MVIGLAKGSSRRVREFLRKLDLSVGKCFDDFEFTSLLRGINREYGGDDYWLLGWREYRVGNYSSVFALTLIDKYYNEYLVRVYVSVGTVSIVMPTDRLNLSDEATGITILINGDTASLSGRVLCITNIEVKKIN